MGHLVFTIVSLILGSPVFAAIDRTPIENCVKDYVAQVAKGKIAGLEDDSEDFAECAKSSCKVVLRRPVILKNEDEDDENAPEIFEVQIDVFKSGQMLARRSGCYIVNRKDGQLSVQDYKYECSE